MKKLFFIAAITGAALVSCTKNELAPSATEQHEINFASPVTSLVTKGVDLVTGNLYPTSAPFWVFADHHMDVFASTTTNQFTSYMRGTDSKGVMVSHNNGAAPGSDSGTAIDTYWKPATKYYWPMQGYLTFAAYSTGTTTTAGLSGYESLTYDVTKGLQLDAYTVSSSNQYDLMISERATDRKKEHSIEGTTATKYDGVEIQFKHALSAVKFAVKTASDYSTDKYTITLTSLSVQGAYTTADLIQFPGDGETMWSDYKNDKTGTTPSSYTVPFAEGTTLTLSTAETTFCGNLDTDLVLLPQALNSTDNTHDVKVYMTYTVHHPDMGEGKVIPYTATLDLAANTLTTATWDAGKRYLYTIIIGMEEIVFAPTIVTDWAAETDQDINL